MPLVFHGTNLKALTRILGDGQIRPSKCSQCVSLTELPITELSRLRSLGSRVSEVAIGFPRVVLEAKGLFQPAYLKHTSDIVKEAFRNLPKGYVEIDQDLGALHEVRVPGSIPLDDAVWILCSVATRRAKRLTIQFCYSVKNEESRFPIGIQLINKRWCRSLLFERNIEMRTDTCFHLNRAENPTCRRR